MYTEYYDLFLKAQKRGLYQMFVFDIVKSRSYEESGQIKEISRLLVSNVYQRLKELENKLNIKILHHINIDDIEEHFIDYAYEPFQSGDCFGFTILRDSIDKKEVYKIFEEEKNKLNVYWDFHKIDGYYETDDFLLGLKEYYRGYCRAQLEDLSKLKDKKTKRILKKNNI